MTYSAVNLLGRTRAVAMTNATFDVVVVGAGIFGSCTAYHCQKLGLKTLLLEKVICWSNQTPLPLTGFILNFKTKSLAVILKKGSRE
ncbi:unnamed protein product [Haemonchus placei]|uniref:DAO domain-containing protein n=1 Tax=Haemonchus placei TaxID=6290 RepID=A0A0N4X620_HAEPC|nr:unnamed protein product [Haemonchus placei]